MPEPQILGMGGSPDDALLAHTLALARGRRVLYVPTAGAETAASILFWYERLRGLADVRHLSFFPWPPEDLRELTLDHDVILVSGGNTANALAIWRVHGFDEILRDAWREGVLLAGWSAGMICWFERGVTDSFGPQLAAMDCLGFLPWQRLPALRRRGAAAPGLHEPRPGGPRAGRRGRRRRRRALRRYRAA